jgi:hypothetical protein
MPDLQPTPYRVTVTTLIIAAAADVLLWKVSGVEDTFANIIAVASGLCAVVLLASAVLTRYVRWREEALLLSFAVWIANLIEVELQEGIPLESKFRQGGFYLAFAVLSLGSYLVARFEATDGR